GIALGCSDRSIVAPPLARLAADPLPDPAASRIEHVIVFMMENRSFDHFLGWLPGADGKQAGLSYADSGGVQHATFPLAPDYQGCGYADPDHSTRADASSTTTARATGGCASTTSSPSATTARKTTPSSAVRFLTGRPSTNTS